VGGILSSEDGFVTVAGTHLLTTLFENATIPAEIEIGEPFAKALNIVMDRKDEDLDRIDAMLLIMRFLVEPRESMTQIVRILWDQDDGIFLSFQRHIEGNHAFASLHFFRFIFGAARFFKHWTNKLREIVVESQFPALVVNVIESAQNRKTIEDALIVAHIVMTGIRQTSGDVDESPFSTLASGFAIVNREKHEETISKELQTKTIQNDYLSRIQELEVERDLNAHELGRLRGLSEQSSSEIEFSKHKIEGLESEKEILKRKLKAKTLKLRAATEALRNSETELMTLSLQLTQQEQEANMSTQKSAKLKTRVQSLKQSDAERQTLQNSCDLLEQKVKELETHVFDAQEELRSAAEIIKKERAKRKEIEKLLNVSQDRINEIAAKCNQERLQKEEAERQNERFESLVRKKNETETRATETIAILQKEIDQLRKEKENADHEMNEIRTSMEKLTVRLAELRKERRDLTALAQLIHRITDGTTVDMETLIGQTSLLR
jgi:FtsZ-binding cell division protein ZapB